MVSRLIDEEEFITAIFAEFRDDTVTLANCGHHPPLLIDRQEMRLLDTGEPTPPLGLEPEPALVEHPWEPSARLLLYTDGLVEARDRRGRFFALEDQRRRAGRRLRWPTRWTASWTGSATSPVGGSPTTWHWCSRRTAAT